jgi:hypothetical protein
MSSLLVGISRLAINEPNVVGHQGNISREGGEVQDVVTTWPGGAGTSWEFMRIFVGKIEIMKEYEINTRIAMALDGACVVVKGIVNCLKRSAK